MAKTRNSKAASKTAAVKTTAEAIAATSKAILGPEDPNPPMPFVLPRDMSVDARIFTLADQGNPMLETRYMCCPEKGFFQLIKTTAPSSTKSWLVVPWESQACREKTEEESQHEHVEESVVEPQTSPPDEEEAGKFTIGKGYVAKSRDMFIATPIDPLFLILPALAPVPTKRVGSEKQLFLSIDDYFERLTTISPQIGSLLSFTGTRQRLEFRIAAVCDAVDAGDEKMYRFDESKLLQEIWKKAKIMVNLGLPASMEEKFVTQPLFNPITSNKLGETLVDEDSESVKAPISGPGTPALDMTDSQTTVSSTPTLSTSESSASTEATSVSDIDSKKSLQPGQATTTSKSPEADDTTTNGITELLRLRTAINFISSSYLSPHLQQALTTRIQDPNLTPQDFQPLETHLAHLAEIRKDLASRSLNDYARKRPLNDNEAESRAEKKARMAEEEKRKRAGESRAVKNLKKVDVSGMKKMSDFFKKK